ncbi:MAG: MG2 domain-containing protein, partial [Bacillota bacterium]
MNLLAFLLFFPSFAQQQISVKSVTPTGSQRHVEQVRIEFVNPMVKLGEYRIDTPAQSDCFKNGQGRWIDTKNWVYDFNKQLPGGRSCEIKVGDKVYSFNTGGPHILNVYPQTYNDIDPEQTFLIFLDSEYDRKSLEQGAYFVIQGLGDRVPVKILEGGEAEKVRTSALEQYSYEKENFQGPWVVLKSSRAFPAEAKVSLVWSRGIKSPKGISSLEDETSEFNVQKAFKAEFSCERENTGSPCIPLLTMRLSFTAPIAMTDAKAIYILLPDGKKVFAKGLDGKTVAEQISYLEFPGPFPIKTKLKVVLPDKIKDDENRELSNQSQFPLQVETGDDPSLLKFAAEFGVIENQPNAALPVTMRQVEKTLITQFSGWTGKLSAKKFKDIIAALGRVMREPYGAEKSSVVGAVTQKIQVKKPMAPSETEVVGIPLKGPGFYVVEMQSALLGKSLIGKAAPYYVRSAALVTDMAVHLKYINSVAWVWVTQLKTGTPVMEAQVSLYDVRGHLVGSGKTDSQGWAEIQIASLGSNDDGPFMDGFFAVAEKGDDFTFTYSGWDQGIEPWRFQIGEGERQEGLVGHTILDRSLLRPEQNVSGKVVLRRTTARGLALPGAKEWPSSLSIVHDSGLQTFNVPMIWDKKIGAANWQWNIPAGAKLGRWSLRLNGPKKDTVIEVGFLNVESFRIPLLQVRVQGSKPFYVQEKSATLSVMGSYLSGGPAQDLPLKIRWSVEQSSFIPQDSDYNEYLFANGGIKEGVFRSGDEENARFIAQSGSQESKLDKTGNLVFDINKLKYGAGPQRLRVETEYKDPNGVIQNAVRSFGLWPSNVVLGVKADGWTATPSRFPISVVALNLQQRPVKNQSIQVDLYTSRYYSHRKRLVGGFYAYEDFQEVKKIGELCHGQTDNNGLFKCTGKPKVSGSVVAVVTAKDAKGNISQANVNQWVVTDDETQWFGSQSDDRADLIPFKKSYEPGETAEFQLRTPFKDAKVLVTVERESVLHREV